MEPLRFLDQGIRFTVFVDAKTELATDHLTAEARHVLSHVAGPATIAELARQSGRSVPQVRYLVAKLVASGHLTREPLNGRTAVYRIARTV